MSSWRTLKGKSSETERSEGPRLERKLEAGVTGGEKTEKWGSCLGMLAQQKNPSAEWDGYDWLHRMRPVFDIPEMWQVRF